MCSNTKQIAWHMAYICLYLIQTDKIPSGIITNASLHELGCGNLQDSYYINHTSYVGGKLLKGSMK